VVSGRWPVGAVGAGGFFRGQISKNARFWDSDVPYRIGCWWGF
jgi:hypothetical protein